MSEIATQTPELLQPIAPPLTGKKRKFALAWLRTSNYTLAAKEAGAPFHKELFHAQKWMDDRAVQDFIQFHLTTSRAELRIPRSKIRDEMAAVGFSNPMDAVELDDEGRVKRIRLDLLDGRDIKQFKVIPPKEKGGDPGIELQFHPKSDMLRMLGNDSGMFADEGKPMNVVNVHFSNIKDSNTNIQIITGGGK